MTGSPWDTWTVLPVLTSHKLQRVGAIALACLGGVSHVRDLDQDGLRLAVRGMTEDLLATASVEKAKDPGGFWLAVSYLMWPNSAMNTTNRGKMRPAERADRIESWRSCPPPDQWPGVSCALCGRDACGFYGKVDVPLGASTIHRNTTVPGHAGLALCPGCLCSFHALPYGCRIQGGRATALHSWDTDFLHRTTRRQFLATRKQAVGGGERGPSGPYVREQLAVARIRGYPDRRLQADVELLVFSNSNKDQTLEAHSMSEPLANWLRTLLRTPDKRTGLRFLTRACHTQKVAGPALLARILIHAPEQLPARINKYLLATWDKPDRVPAGSAPLAELYTSYLTEVLDMPPEHTAEIIELANRIADVLQPEPDSRALKKFRQAWRSPGELRKWLQEFSFRQLVPVRTGDNAGGGTSALSPTPASRRPNSPVFSERQLMLLFSPERDDNAWYYRELLLTSVLAELVRRGWQADPIEEQAAAAEDEPLTEAALDNISDDEDEQR